MVCNELGRSGVHCKTGRGGERANQSKSVEAEIPVGCESKKLTILMV